MEEWINVYIPEDNEGLYQEILNAGRILRVVISSKFPEFAAWFSIPKRMLKEERPNPPYDFEAGRRLEINEKRSIYVCPHEKDEGNWIRALHYEVEA